MSQWYSWTGLYSGQCHHWANFSGPSTDCVLALCMVTGTHQMLWLSAWTKSQFLLCHCLPFHPLVCLIEFSRFCCWSSMVYISNIHESLLPWQCSYFCSRIPSVCASSTVGPETTIWSTYIMQCNFACLKLPHQAFEVSHYTAWLLPTSQYLYFSPADLWPFSNLKASISNWHFQGVWGGKL